MNNPFLNLKNCTSSNFQILFFFWKLNFFRQNSLEFIEDLSDVYCRLESENGATFQTHRNNSIPYIPKQRSRFAHFFD